MPSHVHQSGESVERMRREPPLVVDLDGTLVKTDLLVESALAFLKRQPLVALVCVPLWLARGKAALKRELAKRVELPVDTLPYRVELVKYLRAQHEGGRRLVLASASDQLLVERVAGHLGLFERCVGSDGRTNLKGERKRDWLRGQYGDRGFDYIGNSRADLAVWDCARRGIVAGAHGRLPARAAQRTELVELTADRPRLVAAHVRALRAHHWVKNTLVFVPLLTAHRINELDLVVSTLLAFSAFCLLTSALYICNDLLDLSSDRRHPRKRHRPLAAGDVPLPRALLLVPVLIAGAIGLSLQLDPSFAVYLAVYGILALAYSLHLKEIVLLDVIVLATLYMLRILAGASVDDMLVSRWLVGFSMFLFLSLALLKRYTEIILMRKVAGRRTTVRGYRARDSGLLVAMGCASGYLSVVVLALYVETATAERLYARNELLWAICPVLLYWISYLWLMAHRNRMIYDPVVFALRNNTSRTLVLIAAALVVAAV